MREFPITKNDADQRLDKFLKKLFVNATRGLIYKWNRKWKIKIITIEGKKKKQANDYKLQLWEKLQIFLSEDDFLELTKSTKKEIEISKKQKFSKSDIVYEDESLFIVNKNPGQNVHPWNHKTKEISLIEQVQDYLWKENNSFTFKPSLAHRIDRDTSGILLIAKEKQTLVKLVTDFKEKNTIKKTYFTLVVWKLSRKSWTITKKLKRIENAKNENKVQISEWGQTAVTHYKLIKEYRVKLPNGEQIISSVEIIIETGRTHQIRVHMASIGTPILWDNTYGDKKLNYFFQKKFWVNRQMLHAWKIEFYYPKKKKTMKLEAKLKIDIKRVIENIS